MQAEGVKREVCFFPNRDLRRLLILGLGRHTVNLVRLGRELGLDFTVLTGPRQLTATLADGTLAVDALAALDVEPVVRESLVESEAALGEPAGTLVFSVGCPFIIRQWLIDRFEGRVINSHGAPLPRWRGGGGYSWRIMAGDHSGNSLIHLVTPGIDDGPVVCERGYSFPEHLRRPLEFMNHAEAMDREMFEGFLGGVAAGESFVLRHQDESVATYFPRLSTEDQAFIDWSWPGDAVERFLLAFSTPYAGAKTFLRGAEVRILDARFQPGTQPGHPFLNGLVIRVHDGRLCVVVEGGCLDILLADTVGMDKVQAGDRLATPRDLLENALALRPVYAPTGLKAKA